MRNPISIRSGSPHERMITPTILHSRLQRLMRRLPPQLFKVALRWPLEFWLKLKTTKAFDSLGRQIGRLSSRLKKWNARRIKRTEKKLGK